MKHLFRKNRLLRKQSVWIVAVFLFFSPGLLALDVKAGMKDLPPETIDAIIIGDRVVDIAYNLGVLPKAMSVRGSQWKMAQKLRIGSQILGCPMFTTVKKKQTIPDALKKFGVKRVIAEKTDHFCLYKPEVKPDSIAQILKGSDVTVEYVDFAGGVESAVRQVAKLVGREDRVDALLEKYKKSLAKAQAMIPKELGKKVLVFNGTYQHDTGKLSLRVEAPGFYTDHFFLTPMGCTNVGDAFKPADGKSSKGHYPVQKRKHGLVLDPLLTANPDVIVLVGNAYAGQKALATYVKTHPETAAIPAIKNQAIFSLPHYVDSSVLEFPRILLQWSKALSD